MTSSSLTIAVADDEPRMREYYQETLSRMGHRVAVAAATGRELIEGCRATPPDLILSDIKMPELDGIEAAKRIRAREAGQPGRRTPILALTANALVEDRYACFEAGMDGFLVKPLDRDKLGEVLADVRLFPQLAVQLN